MFYLLFLLPTLSTLYSFSYQHLSLDLWCLRSEIFILFIFVLYYFVIFFYPFILSSSLFPQLLSLFIIRILLFYFLPALLPSFLRLIIIRYFFFTYFASSCSFVFSTHYLSYPSFFHEAISSVEYLYALLLSHPTALKDIETQHVTMLVDWETSARIWEYVCGEFIPDGNFPFQSKVIVGWATSQPHIRNLKSP